MLNINEIPIDDFYRVAHGTNPTTGLDAIIAVHSVKLGTAVGGAILNPYSTFDYQLRDALYRCKGISLKHAAVNMQKGGGKSVIKWSNPYSVTEDLAKSFGEFLNEFNKNEEIYCIAGYNSNCIKDLGIISKYTNHIKGLNIDKIELANASAYTVYKSIKSALDYKNIKLEDAHVAIQGVGNLGMFLVRLLSSHGTTITVADKDASKTHTAKNLYGCNIHDYTTIHTVDCDVFSPCAFPRSIIPEDINELNCKIICGGADHQLEHVDMITDITDKGITFIPEYIVNSGSAILATNTNNEVTYDSNISMNAMDTIYDVVTNILQNCDKGMDSFSATRLISYEKLK